MRSQEVAAGGGVKEGGQGALPKALPLVFL